MHLYPIHTTILEVDQLIVFVLTVLILLHWGVSDVILIITMYQLRAFSFSFFLRLVRWICCGPCVTGEVSSSAKMRPMVVLPRPILPAFLALTFVAFLAQLSSGATPFPQDLEPISVVGRESKFKICCCHGDPCCRSTCKSRARVTKAYLVTGGYSLVRWMCLRLCLQQANL